LSIGYYILNLSTNPIIHGLSSIPLNPIPNPHLYTIGELENIIQQYENNIRTIEQQIENIKKNPLEKPTLEELLKLMQQLESLNIELNEFKDLLVKIKKDTPKPSSPPHPNNDTKNVGTNIGTNTNNIPKDDNIKTLKDEIEKLKAQLQEEFAKKQSESDIENLKARIKELEAQLEKQQQEKDKSDSNDASTSALKAELEEMKKTMQEYEREILRSKNRESQQKNKNQFIRKILEAQQERLNKLLIKLSLEKTKSSTNLIKLLQNIILILQQFSEVSKNRNNTKYYTNVHKILEQLKTDSIKTLKEIEIQKLNKNSSNYNKIINQLKEILKSILGEIN
jgi:hypothetical protein